MSIVDRIALKSGALRAASRAGIDRLESLGMPEEELTFCAVFKPVRTIEIERVRWPIAAILEENADYVPGAYVHSCGYVVFATTDCGDAFAFANSSSRTSNPTVVVVHNLEAENDRMKREDLETLAKPVAPYLESLLEALASGALGREPLPPPFDWGQT